MNFKEKLQKRLEKNAIKVNVNGEDILMKKSGLLTKEWHRFHPPINEDGSWNWINFIFGGKYNLVNLLAILGIIALLFLGLNQIFTSLQSIIDTPCVQSCLNQITP